YHFTFESPEISWGDSWQIGKQILTNLVFSADASKGLIFSIDPPLPPDDVLQAKALEAARAMGMTLAYDNRAEGLFAWRFEPKAVGSASADLLRPVVGCFSWYMKRVG